MISHQKSAALKEQATNYLQSDDFKSMVPYLMSGGVGALAGGAMTGLHARGAGLVDQGKDVAANPGQLLDKGAVLAGDPGDEGDLPASGRSFSGGGALSGCGGFTGHGLGGLGRFGGLFERRFGHRLGRCRFGRRWDGGFGSGLGGRFGCGFGWRLGWRLGAILSHGFFVRLGR